MVTVKDVAQAASVSPATVSRVLNGSGYVSPDVRARVLEVVQGMGYTPNASARSLKSRITETIGLVLTDLDSSFFSTIAQGALQVATQSNYHLILCTSEDDPVREEAYLQLLIRKGVDGIVLMPTGANRRTLRALKERDIKIVQVDRMAGELSEDDAVLVDNIKGAYEATKHLLGLGHTRVGIICGPPHVTTGKERLLGYRKAMEEAGLELDPGLIKSGPFKRETGYRGAAELLQAAASVTAIFATSDHFCEGTLQALRDLDVAIPERVTVVGWDDRPWATFITPRLTVVSQPAFAIGTTAVQLLLQRIKNDRESGSPIVTRFDPALIIRESCAPPRSTVRV